MCRRADTTSAPESLMNVRFLVRGTAGRLVAIALARLASPTIRCTRDLRPAHRPGRQRAGQGEPGVSIAVSADGTAAAPLSSRTTAAHCAFASAATRPLHTVTKSKAARAELFPTAAASRSSTGPADLTFAAAPLRFVLLGMIVDANGSPLGGAAVARSGQAPIMKTNERVRSLRAHGAAGLGPPTRDAVADGVRLHAGALSGGRRPPATWCCR